MSWIEFMALGILLFVCWKNCSFHNWTARP